VLKQYKYWMVHKSQTGQSCSKQHFTVAEAHQEAKRLAASNIGCCFSVLEVVACYIAPKPAAMSVPIETVPAIIHGCHVPTDQNNNGVDYKPVEFGPTYKLPGHFVP
jgi:hypothetical protein